MLSGVSLTIIKFSQLSQFNVTNTGASVRGPVDSLASRSNPEHITIVQCFQNFFDIVFVIELRKITEKSKLNKKTGLVAI